MPVANDLYYFTYQNRGGDVLPLVLIHGAGGTHLNWPPQIRRLPGCRVFALDLPGHGKSRDNRGCQSIEEYTRHILSWFEAVGLHRAIFVGHSMGSAIALNVGLGYPQQVLGLVLIGSGVQLPVNVALLEEASNSATYSNAVDMVVRWSFSLDAPANLTVLASRRMRETRQSVFYGDLLACNAFNVKGRLEQVRCPTLVVCGEQDKMTPIRANQYLASQIPDARLELVAGAGHMVMLEQPDNVASLLRNFLEQNQFHYGDML
jgi:pimeloyl-ACP methyl ester carboxylesterase